MAEQSENLEQFPVKSLTDVFEKIYMEHNKKPPVKYTLTASAKELFFKYSKPSEESQSASPSSCEGSTGSKKLKNILRVALNMHVLYHRLKKFLSLEAGTTPTVIGAQTLQMAISFTETLETMKGVSELSCSLKKNPVGLKVGATPEDIKKRILCLPGPFVSVRRVVRSFSSTRRPSSKAAQDAMAALHTAEIGSMLTLNKLVVFLKKIPPLVNKNQVTACGVTPQKYKAAFDEKDTKLTTDIQETVMEAHPQREEVEAYLSP